ncbi:MAG: asparaginase [Gemmatimonadales bacterium]
MHPLEILAHRGTHVESRHRVHVAVVDPAGHLVAQSGDPAFPTFLRSAAKPFQAWPVVTDGAADAFGLTTEALALACASHNSERVHVNHVTAMLARAGLTEADLVCGGHRPLWRELAVRLPDEAEPDAVPQTAVASNCSGKHAAMLILARHRQWPTAGYQQLTHPVQLRGRVAVAHWAGLQPDAIGLAVDGCGVACFQVPLAAMAGAFARFGTSDDPAAKRLADAMTAHPYLVGGLGRLDTALLSAGSGRILSKVGADGVYGVALRDRGLGIAVKVEDGHARASMVALVATLAFLEAPAAADPALARFTQFPLRNTRGESVGSLTASGTLAKV